MKTWTYYHNKDTEEGGLFTEHIQTFLKIKQESSGFPKGVNSEEEKQIYIQDDFNHEGVKLENISKNAGLRSLSRLALNTLFGYFALRSNLTQMEYISEPIKLWEKLESEEFIVKDVIFINDDIIRMEYAYNEGLGLIL